MLIRSLRLILPDYAPGTVVMDWGHAGCTYFRCNAII